MKITSSQPSGIAGVMAGTAPASGVTVIDTGGNYTGTDLETILAEIAADLNLDTSLVTVAASGATETIDVSVARTYDVTLTANCTLTLTGAVTAQAWYVTLLLRQDGVGSRTVTWPGSVVWPGGITPVLATAANAVDVFTLFTLNGGTVWFGFPTGVATITVKDEGTPLATAATSLDFVGAGVVASGTGAAKTITIAGATEAAVRDAGRWEVVVSGSAPPVAVSNPDDDDWVYAWVSG